MKDEENRSRSSHPERERYAVSAPTSEALVTNVHIIRDRERPFTLLEVVLVHLIVERVILRSRGVVTVAEPVEHLVVWEEPVIVDTKKLLAEFLLAVRHAHRCPQVRV